MKILFFDDDKYLSDAFQKSLRDTYKHDVVFFSKIPDFLSALKSKEQYDLIILDIMVPLINGTGSALENTNFSKDEISEMKQGLNTGEVLYKKIREEGKYKFTPILFYSAKGALETIKNDSNTLFIQKPVLVKEVNNKIEEMFKK